jgi:hypothetical protein
VSWGPATLGDVTTKKVQVFKNDGSIQPVLRSFLETTPLYYVLRFEHPDQEVGWPKSLSLHCDHELCRKVTTWTQHRMNPQFSVGGYKCGLCHEREVVYWFDWNRSIKADAVSHSYVHEVRKIGQTPAWSVAVSKGIQDALNTEALPFYKKAQICLSQNFGLGAVAYFRRVVEIITADLIDLIEQAANLDPANPDTSALEAVAQARASHQASDRLKLVASVIPAHLKPGGKNPLAALYEVYSEGVHQLSDEESSGVALTMHASIEYLIPGLAEQLKAAHVYQTAIVTAKRRK